MSIGKNASARKASKPKSDKKQGTAIIIKPDYSGQYSTLYANYASVNSTPWDFSIDFCLVPPAVEAVLDSKAEGPTVTVPIVARVILPKTLLEALPAAMRLHSEMMDNLTEKEAKD